MPVDRTPLPGALLGAFGGLVVAVTMAFAAPASAATSAPRACPTKGTATSTCVITWDGRAFAPASTSVQSGVTVEWANAGSLIDGTVTISYLSGPTKFSSFTVSRGAAPKGVRLVASRQAKEGVEGEDRTSQGVGGITVVPPPAASPTPSATKSPSPRASQTPTHATPTATPPATATAVTNPPPLGVGQPSPTPKPAPTGPNPLVASPLPTDRPDAASAEPPAAPRSLSQAVPARRYGLPGALAAVLIAGVAGGLVRVVRADLENGGSSTSDEPSTDSR